MHQQHPNSPTILAAQRGNAMPSILRLIHATVNGLKDTQFLSTDYVCQLETVCRLFSCQLPCAIVSGTLEGNLVKLSSIVSLQKSWVAQKFSKDTTLESFDSLLKEMAQNMVVFGRMPVSGARANRLCGVND